MSVNRNTKYPVPKNELYFWDDVEKVLKPLVDTDGLLAVKSAGDFSVGISSSEIMQPVDIQSHYQQTIQGHVGVTIPPESYSSSVWIDTAGFNELAISVQCASSQSHAMTTDWSFDGVNPQGFESVKDLPSAGTRMTVSIPTKARYIKFNVRNNLTTPNTVSSWVYLKA